MIDTGEVANATDLARRFRLEIGWVCEVLRMTRLAPDMVQAILDGRQPRHMNLHAVRGRQAEVPLTGMRSDDFLGSSDKMILKVTVVVDEEEAMIDCTAQSGTTWREIWLGPGVRLYGPQNASLSSLI